MRSDHVPPPAIAACGVDFGWGSAGKISAIAAALQRAGRHRFVVFGTRLGRPVLCGLPVAASYERRPSDPAELQALFRRHGVVAGLVVLDPGAAEAFEAAGCPTVYVDSLPFLWTAADQVPAAVTRYCAQRYPGAPSKPSGVLATIQRLTWVDPITAASVGGAARRATGTAVVNLGGLHSPTNVDGNPQYCRLVLRPALDALRRAGYNDVHVCGNLAAVDLPDDSSGRAPVASVGPRTHAEFLSLLSTVAVLVTSPGLTTLLEAARSATPTVCLPPQNLSQIHNGDRFALANNEALRIAWPADVLDLARVEAAREHGEKAALEVIDAALHTADPARVHPHVSDALTSALDLARLPRRWDSLVRGAGDGAAQVADVLRGVIAASAEAPRDR